MKNIILAFSFILTLTICSGQIPYNMAEVVDNLFIDKTEVSNYQYRDYLNELLKIKGSKAYQKALPDTGAWRNIENSYVEPLVENYFRHPAFDTHPVVGISYQQAQNFCIWRNKVVQTKKNGQAYWVFRLPTQLEWNLVARLNRSRLKKEEWVELADTSPKLKRLSKNSEIKSALQASDIKIPAFNLKRKKMPNFFTAPAKSYQAGELGIYNLYGNVAEIVYDEGVSMGGSYIHTKTEAFFEKGIAYESPQSWLGFRCICELKERE